MQRYKNVYEKIIPKIILLLCFVCVKFSNCLHYFLIAKRDCILLSERVTNPLW